MPREAIMMHGTAEAFELVNKTMGEQLRPFIEKLDTFAADSTIVLSQEEILSLKRDMTTMKNASANGATSASATRAWLRSPMPPRTWPTPSSATT